MAYNLEEQESIDNLKGWWEKWGTPVLVVITLACVGVAGYNGWKWWNHRQTAKASVAYVALETAVNNQDGKNIKSISDGLIDQYGSTVYGPMAAFVAARYAADNGDIATAKQKLQWVVDHGDRKEFEAIARVRLAGLLMDEKAYDKALTLLTGFTPATDTERLVIDDRLGDVYQAMGKNAEARKAWQDGIAAARDGDPLQNLIRLKLDSLPEDGTAAPAPAAASAAASSAAASAPASPPAAKSSAAG